MVILHLAGLNFRNNFNAEIVYESLLKRISEDVNDGIVPELIIISGGITYFGNREYYLEVKNFFANLLRVLNLSEDRIFFVPGKRDLSDGNKIKLQNYQNFVEVYYPHMRIGDNSPALFVNSYTSKNGKKIALIGLNYSMIESGNEIDLLSVKEKIKDSSYRINIIDLSPGGLYKTFFQGSFVLCRGKEFDARHNGSFLELQTGSVYLGSDCNPGIFEYVTIDFKREEIRRHHRKFVPSRRIWSLDGESGIDGVSTLSISNWLK